MRKTSSNQKPSFHKVSLLRQMLMVTGIGVILATLFTAWTPLGLVATNLADTLTNNQQYLDPNIIQGEYPTPTSRPRPRVGIVAGHWRNDTGAVCADGLTEVSINLKIATLVKEKLVENNFDVDLLEEFDVNLAGYRGLALVSIHADSCDYVNDLATGYKVAAALSSTNIDRASRLTACLRNRYAETTGLSYHSGSITDDMTSYHAFEEIHHETTAAIIETGFLNLDRQILTQYPDSVAEGISQGILCFIYNENVNKSPTPEG